MQEVSNVLRIFEEAKSSIDQGHYYKLKFLSDQTIHTATIAQDPDNVIVAVVIYALGKIFEREHYKEMPGWQKFQKEVLLNIDAVIRHLRSGEIVKARIDLGKIRNAVNNISGNLRLYITDVFEKASINKAFKIYEHGLSDEQTAKLLGISLWDLASYIGQSGVHETKLNQGIPTKKRINFAEEIFKK